MNRRMAPLLFVAFIVTVSSVGSTAATAQEPMWDGALVHKIDSMAAATLADGRISGFSIGVMRGHEVVHTQGYGFADLDHQVSAGPNTVYQIASVTKHITAAAVLRAVEQGLLSLDAPITQFFPDYPTQGHHVTVRHLLTHTSGVRSYPSDDTPLEPLALEISDAELLEVIQGEPFDFAPGESFRYSNAGFVLLGMIVATVSDQTYGEYLRDHLFEPLGMSRSTVCDLNRVTPGRARGYSFEDSNFTVIDHTVSPTHMGGAGMVCSSVVDMLTWWGALTRGEVVSEAHYASMVTPATLMDGTEVPYGFGLQVRPRLEGNLTIFHGGGATGFSSRLDYYPEADLTITVMSNTYGTHSGLMTDAIARWALGIPMPVVLDEPRSDDELDVYVGVYDVSTPEQVWRVERVGSELFLTIGDRAPTRLRSQGNHVFVPAYSAFSRLTFSVDGVQATRFDLRECQVMNQELCRTREGSRQP